MQDQKQDMTMSQCENLFAAEVRFQAATGITGVSHRARQMTRAAEETDMKKKA